MTYIVHGERMTSREAAHEELKRALELPDYYGRNLDALWDLISAADADVVLVNASSLLRNLGAYGCKILTTFYEAMEENDGFTLTIGEDTPAEDLEDQSKALEYEE